MLDMIGDYMSNKEIDQIPFENVILDPSILVKKELSPSNQIDLDDYLHLKKQELNFFTSAHFLSYLESDKFSKYAGFSGYLKEKQLRSPADILEYYVDNLKIKKFDYRENLEKLDIKLKDSKYNEVFNSDNIKHIFQRPLGLNEAVAMDNLVFMLTNSPMISRLKSSMEEVSKKLEEMATGRRQSGPLIDLTKHVPPNMRRFVRFAKNWGKWVGYVASINELNLIALNVALSLTVFNGIALLIIDP